MLERGIAPDSYTYSSILEGLCREAKAGAACEIFKMSMQQDIKLAQFVLTTLIRSLCKQVLLKGLVDAGEMDMALEHIQWLVKSSPRIPFQFLLN
ncbi:hypothetical protein FRX31_031772 [Thalictrum thalictroides]|uniref:Pentatricopeptide repeat-containing protein n=1 Tax=Thalictrum thalictroides TaxID=46969 RepID=A0A7J6V2L2_THATH|nr:hypothetical protein FRX31_031772 [Thalictrum thalictroides]